MPETDPRLRPLRVPDELLERYEEDLATWRQMVARWGEPMTWRDEQSFKRAWMVSRRRVEDELVTDVDLVFHDMPSHEPAQFIEAEVDGASVNVGAWSYREDGLAVLKIRAVLPA